VEAEAPTYAAISKIRVKVNKTENREVHVVVDHLAPPYRIGPQYRGYAVWASVPGIGTSKLGVLRYNERQRRGTLVATTPHSKFEVFITLEGDRATTVPSSMVIVRKVVGRV